MHGVQTLEELARPVGEHELRAGDAHAVQQGLPGQVVVDEGRRGADGPETHPREHEVRTVAHEQGDQITRGHALRQEEVRELVGARVGAAPGVGARPPPYALFAGLGLRISLEEVVRGDAAFPDYGLSGRMSCVYV